MKNRVIILLSVFAALIILDLTLSFIREKFPTPLKELDLAEELTMTIEEGSLTPTSAKIIITNQSDTTYHTGRDYRIDKFVDGNWYKVKMKRAMEVLADGIIITKDYPYESTPNWENCYGILEPGKYRIVKKVSTDLSKPSKDKDIAVEFFID